jgi:proline iminopeptidase
VLFHFWDDEHRRFDFRDELSEITCPVAVVHGGLDPITPPERSREIVHALDKAQVDHVFKAEAGHGVYRDEPEFFARWLIGFVESLSQTGSIHSR